MFKATAAVTLLGALDGVNALNVGTHAVAAGQVCRVTVRMGTGSDEMGIPCVGECALGSYPKMPESVHPGVLTGDALMDLRDRWGHQDVSCRGACSFRSIM